MNWTIQGADDITVDAAPGVVWALLVDGNRLPDWAFLVKHTTGGPEHLGGERHCDVDFEGRKGKVAERCVEFLPERRIAWVMTEDSLGFSKMFADMGFSFTLEAVSDGRTLVRNESFFRPKNWMARWMTALVMRRKFRALRRRLLGSLKALAEASGPLGCAVAARGPPGVG